MLIHVGDDRNERIDLGLAAIMSAVAGALNAVGFQVAGLFSANMTGNVSALAEHAAQGSWASSAAFAALIGCFVTGASCAAGLIHLGETAQARPIYALVILGEALRLHGTTILTFAAGGVLGTLVYAAIGAWLFGATAAVLLAVSVPEILRAARGPQP